MKHAVAASIAGLILAGCGGTESPSPSVSDEIGSVSASPSELASDAAPACLGSGGEEVAWGPTGDPSAHPAPGPTSEMSIGDLLRTDHRFEGFRALTELARSPGLGLSWIEIWDLPGERIGDDQDGVTVFVPTDAAFEALEPDLAASLSSTETENDLLYSLIGHHYVHRVYPSSEFEPGPQRTWSGSGSVGMSAEPLAFGGCAVLEADLMLANGIVHVIDGIVMPQEIRRVLLDQTE